MNSRRNFLQQLSKAAAGAAMLPVFVNEAEGAVFDHMRAFSSHSAEDITIDEDFWSGIRSQYTVSPNILNLNNGGVSPQPKIVQDAHIRFYQYSNEAPSYYMWRILDQGREALRQKLGELSGCDPEEIAINRNTTEGLNTIIFGMDLQRGDEVILSKFDYPNMMNAWKQREKRDGIKLVWVDLELPKEDDAYFVSQYTKAFTSRTKVVHLTHLINWTGQIIPVRKIADVARQKGIEVIVDGSHSYAHLNYQIPELGADYYATSLHKWLCAPFGSGLMYIKKDKIKKIWALLSAVEPDGADIRKFESLGTRSFASEMAIGTAVDFHNGIGGERKFQRLHYLQRYWTDKARYVEGVKVWTSAKPEYAGALSHFSVGGLKSTEVDAILFNKFKIHTVGIAYEYLNGVRVTPNVYTSTRDLDRLVAAIKYISSQREVK